MRIIPISPAKFQRTIAKFPILIGRLEALIGTFEILIGNVPIKIGKLKINMQEFENSIWHFRVIFGMKIGQLTGVHIAS